MRRQISFLRGLERDKRAVGQAFQPDVRLESLTYSPLVRQLLTFALASILLLLGKASLVNALEPPPVEVILKAWQERQERVRAIQMSWIENYTISKGKVTRTIAHFPQAEDRLKSMGITPGSVVPPTDVTVQIPCAICLDGNKVRYSRDDQQWSGKENRYVLQSYLNVFDGKVGKNFHPQGSSYTPWPQGIIDNHLPEANALSLAPIFMTFRACSPKYRVWDIQTMSFTGRRIVIDGKTCHELEKQQRIFSQRVWLDPSRDFLLLRMVAMKNQQVISRMDVSYFKDKDCGFVPQQWDILWFYPDGKLEECTAPPK